MVYKIEKLSQPNALEIANNWKYPGSYAFYDMTADKEDYEVFISEATRGNQYYQLLKEEVLIGFLAYELIENTVDIGIGMKPSMTGKGQGLEFLNVCIEYLIHKHSNIKEITLAVASFNKRAIKVYEKLEFKEVESFKQNTNGGIYDFIKMRRKI